MRGLSCVVRRVHEKLTEEHSMNPALQASIRTAIEAALAEKNFMTRTEATQYIDAAVAGAIAVELGTDTQLDTVVASPSVASPSAASVKKLASPITSLPAQTSSRGGRRPKQTDDEKKAKRATYQRGYRARQKGRTSSAATPSSSPSPSPSIVPANGAGRKPSTIQGQTGSKKVVTPTAPDAPPLAYVPAVDLGDV